jgi:hypothetical protein
MRVVCSGDSTRSKDGRLGCIDACESGGVLTRVKDSDICNVMSEDDDDEADDDTRIQPVARAVIVRLMRSICMSFWPLSLTADDATAVEFGL